jgi:hypothetical protein
MALLLVLRVDVSETTRRHLRAIGMFVRALCRSQSAQKLCVHCIASLGSSKIPMAAIHAVANKVGTPFLRTPWSGLINDANVL